MLEIKETFGLEDMKKIEELEKKFYDDEFVVCGEEAWEWNQKFPFQQIAAVDNGRIAGFLEMFPVKEAMVQGYLNGELDEQDISVDHMVDIYTAEPGEYAMLICTTLLDEDYRGQGIMRSLFKNRIDFYDSFKEKGITFDNTIADVVSPQGGHLAEKLGMKMMLEMESGSKIYLGSYEEFRNKIMSL